MATFASVPSESLKVRPALDADVLVRSILFIAVFLAVWVSFHPFPSLAEPLEVTEAGDHVNQVGYSVLFLLLAAWSLLHEPKRLMLVLRPILIATLLWCALSVVTSWEPSLSARRFASTLVTIGIASMVLLLPRNARHFSDLMAATVLIVLAACYLGVLLAPSLSIHQATDFIEPELAGDWRGVFGHKNGASATMVLFVFIGLFIARMRSVTLGAVIAALASIFLFFTHSKTSIAVLPLVLIVSVIIARVQRPTVGMALALLVVVALSVLSIGTLYFAPIRTLVDLLIADPSFTGRTEIWNFALDHVAQRPITGYGFATFWGTEQVVYGMGGDLVWANAAGNAHNGYVDLALTIGIPGAILATLWLVVLPLVDYYRSPHEPYSAPLKMLFLRVGLFMTYASCFESRFFEISGAWLFLVAATFGLRFLSLTRLARR